MFQFPVPAKPLSFDFHRPAKFGEQKVSVSVNLTGSYNYGLVALSIVIAITASYAALDLAGRVTVSTRWTRFAWLLGGAAALGIGIWSMHYIGMLAFILPVPVAYHWPTVLLSLVAAILASIIALSVATRPNMGVLEAAIASVLMGLGIAGMHYIGMLAMRLPAMCHYNSFFLILSVLFAVLISLAAIWIFFHFRNDRKGMGRRKLAGAVVLGASIPIMHYTGMAAASFSPSTDPLDMSHAISVSALGATGIAAATLLILGLGMVTSWVDRRFALQALHVQEKRLWQSERYLNEAQRLSHTGSFGWKVGSDDVAWSEETFRIFNYEPNIKPTIDLVFKRIHPDDRKLVAETLERISDEGSEWELTHRLLMPDGSIKHVHVVAHALKDASSPGQYVGAVMDVTEQQSAKSLLAGENRLLEMVATGSSLDLILEDLCRLVEQVSPDALCSVLLLDGDRLRHGAAPTIPVSYIAAITGTQIGPSVGSWGAAAYLRQPIIVSDITLDPVWSCFRDVALQNGLRACWSTPIVASDGHVLGTFDVYSRSPFYPSPELHNIVEQITHLASIAIERKQAEESLQRAQTELAHVTRVMTMGELVAMIAHEVNQPLGAIVTNGQVCERFLSQETPALEKSRDVVKRMVQGAIRASEVIKGIRELMRKTPTEKVKLDMNVIAEETLSLVVGDLRRNNIELRTDFQQDLLPVLGDRVQLQQVLLNLILNAKDAMSSEEHRRLSITTQNGDGGNVAVAVCDTGHGIDSAEIERIFDPFFTKKAGGIGLGLSISRTIIESHGGTLGAAPNNEQGTTIRFALPAVLQDGVDRN